jgi:peptidoglycan hydrolase-like protein with peptidoglycan-binding domain
MKKTLMALAATAIITVPFITSAATFTTWLTVGSRGLDVTALQAILVAQGYLKVVPTGYYGALTKQAVMAYQKANGLEQVGSTGPKTRALLNAYVVAHVPTSSAPMTPIAPSAPVAPAAPISPTAPTAPVSTNTSATTTVTATTTISATPTPSPNDPPHVTLVSPAAVIARISSQTDMVLKTDKAASCRFGTQPGMNFSDMSSFDTNDGLTHMHSFTNLSPDAYYIYYVRCNDMSDRSSQEMTVSFSVTGQ